MVNVTKKHTMGSNEEYSLEEEALIRQWLEYKKVILDKLNPQSLPHTVFQDLNDELKNISYLAGNKFSKADTEILSGLKDSYAAQSIQTKEKYPYLTRWFKHIQHVSQSQLSTNMPFSRTSLY